MKKVFSNRMNGCSLIHFSFLLAFLFLSVNAEAKVKLPSVLADNMVLQQQTDVKLWGQAQAKATLTGTTDPHSTGRWTLRDNFQ